MVRSHFAVDPVGSLPFQVQRAAQYVLAIAGQLLLPAGAEKLLQQTIDAEDSDLVWSGERIEVSSGAQGLQSCV